MSKSIGFTAAFALLCGGISIAKAADDGVWVTCKNGMQMHSGATCEQHGGVRIEMTKSTEPKPIPINASKSPTPNKTASAKKTQKTASSGTSKKKTVSNATRNPTAKCMDGALYFSTQRSGACAKHGGVDKWYGF